LEENCLKNEVKMFEKILHYINAVNFEYMTKFTAEKDHLLSNLREVLDFLEIKRKDEKVEFVHGIGNTKLRFSAL
jgi:hypothetical protein